MGGRYSEGVRVEGFQPAEEFHGFQGCGPDDGYRDLGRGVGYGFAAHQVAVHFRVQNDPCASGGIASARLQGFQKGFQAYLGGVNGRKPRLCVAPVLVAGTVVAGPSRVAVAATEEAEFVSVLQGFPQEPLEAAVC